MRGNIISSYSSSFYPSGADIDFVRDVNENHIFLPARPGWRDRIRNLFVEGYSLNTSEPVHNYHISKRV